MKPVARFVFRDRFKPTCGCDEEIAWPTYSLQYYGFQSFKHLWMSLKTERAIDCSAVGMKS